MWNGLWIRLRGARGIELFAGLAVAALLALMLIGSSGKNASGPPKTELESRLERILERVEGAGRVSAMIVQGDEGEVTGVLIVAEQLGDMQTYLRLQRAVATLMDLQAEQIEIIGGNGAFGGGQ